MISTTELVSVILLAQVRSRQGTCCTYLQAYRARSQPKSPEGSASSKVKHSTGGWVDSPRICPEPASHSAGEAEGRWIGRPASERPARAASVRAPLVRSRCTAWRVEKRATSNGGFNCSGVLQPRPSKSLPQPVTASLRAAYCAVAALMGTCAQLRPAIRPPMPVFDPSSPIHRFRSVQHPLKICSGIRVTALFPSLRDEPGPFHSGLAGGYSDGLQRARFMPEARRTK